MDRRRRSSAGISAPLVHAPALRSLAFRQQIPRRIQKRERLPPSRRRLKQRLDRIPFRRASAPSPATPTPTAAASGSLNRHPSRPSASMFTHRPLHRRLRAPDRTRRARHQLWKHEHLAPVLLTVTAVDPRPTSALKRQRQRVRVEAAARIHRPVPRIGERKRLRPSALDSRRTLRVSPTPPHPANPAGSSSAAAARRTPGNRCSLPSRNRYTCVENCLRPIRRILRHRARLQYWKVRHATPPGSRRSDASIRASPAAPPCAMSLL